MHQQSCWKRTTAEFVLCLMMACPCCWKQVWKTAWVVLKTILWFFTVMAAIMGWIMLVDMIVRSFLLWSKL